MSLRKGYLDFQPVLDFTSFPSTLLHSFHPMPIEFRAPLQHLLSEGLNRLPIHTTSKNYSDGVQSTSATSKCKSTRATVGPIGLPDRQPCYHENPAEQTRTEADRFLAPLPDALIVIPRLIVQAHRNITISHGHGDTVTTSLLKTIKVLQWLAILKNVGSPRAHQSIEARLPSRFGCGIFSAFSYSAGQR